MMNNQFIQLYMSVSNSGGAGWRVKAEACKGHLKIFWRAKLQCFEATYGPQFSQYHTILNWVLERDVPSNEIHHKIPYCNETDGVRQRLYKRKTIIEILFSLKITSQHLKCLQCLH